MNRFDRLLRMMPLPAKRALKAAAEPIDWLWLKYKRRRDPEYRDVPGVRLRSRVGAGFRPSEYLEGGQLISQDLEPFTAALPAHAKVLDFGCGSGRVIVPLARHRPDLDLTGSDVDREAIEWASNNVRPARFFVNNPSPPLDVDDETFDFVFSISIFTHLPEEAQLEWITELRRVVAKDGKVLITTCGRRMLDQIRAGDVASNSADFTRRLRSVAEGADVGDFRFLPYVRSRANERDFSGVQAEYGLTFQSPDYCERAWAPWFEVESVAPGRINGSQDALLLKPR